LTGRERTLLEWMPLVLYRVWHRIRNIIGYDKPRASDRAG